MSRLSRSNVAWLLVGVAILPSLVRAADAANTPSDSAAKPAMVALSLETGWPKGPTRLNGRDARQQLLATATDAAGQKHDVTATVKFITSAPAVVAIDATGLATPTAQGAVTVTTTLGNLSAKTELVVENFAADSAISFPNQIVPMFTKLGCNGGGCHGKSGGQNGFRLSLLGFEPAEDFEHLVKEGRGRRLFPAAADRSLLLLKAVNAAPHGGGQRMDLDSPEYRLMRRWIAQGAAFGPANPPTVTRISVFPEQLSLPRRSRQQLVALAHYSDGSIEDVTRLVKYESNDNDLAEASATGLVQIGKLAGNASVMARYQGAVAVFRATVPLGVKVDKLPPTKNVVDELVFKQLKTLGMPPSPVCDDGTFIRRATVDIAGRLPSVQETEQFIASKDANKRDQLVDRLLASSDYADYFANKWNAILRNRRRQPGYIRGTYGFHEWIRDALADNVPYDQFVRGVLAASGEMGANPPVAWFREVNEVEQQIEDSAQLFLGLRIQCARCHHHPFEKWSQRDYYSYGAFFSRVGKKPGVELDDQIIFHRRGAPSMANPKTGEQLKPTGLGAKPLELPNERDPRQALVDWMADPSNEFFAPALVNRYWKHFLGRGLVEPEDDMRVTNPPSNPELMAALSRGFVDSGFNLKQLIRTICTSTTYQLSAEPNQYNADDKQNFSRYYPKRLAAEVLLDALDTTAAATTGFNGLPAGTRAVQLPDSGVNSYFLTVFGRPEMTSACECERTGDANLAQSLHLLNSADVQGKLTAGSGRAALLAKDTGRPVPQKVNEIYMTVYSRAPSQQELDVAAAYLGKHSNQQQAYEDILWALVNTKEFLFNH
ncbi:MAG: DUF1549 domain-containing protein [Planctomycetes bacterium]|nr:DUF1549 domain-containing protein [Planctomycetota bacterium]